MTWVEAGKEHGHEAVADEIMVCVRAEQLLLIAVEMVDLDWCIDILQRIKDSGGESRSMLDIILGVSGKE